jgi:hypothetical protein
MFSPIKYVQSALGKLFTPSPAGKTLSGKKGRGRPRGGVSKPRKRKQHIKSDLKKPKRPTSAYVVFATEVRKSVVEKDPSLKPTEVTKVIGERWRACKPEDRVQYEKVAAVDRKRYEKEMKQYKVDFEKYSKTPEGIKDQERMALQKKIKSILNKTFKKEAWDRVVDVMEGNNSASVETNSKTFKMTGGRGKKPDAMGFMVALVGKAEAERLLK